ncbi:MAG: pyrimidine 5-nucleotidase, partial [Deltaproteobacteria bacterium]|nr:pyrimidine 5-nucleotidase [Deltaproteobacteria bacterium]
DNTLYPKSLGIFDLVIERIRNYLEVRLGYEKERARELRQESLRKYGSTLRGLMIHQNVDPADYLEYVHDVGVEERLTPNPDLAQLLKSIPCDRAIFTSGHRPHALKVLRCLGVEEFYLRHRLHPLHPQAQPGELYRQILECVGLEGTASWISKSDTFCSSREFSNSRDFPSNLYSRKSIRRPPGWSGHRPWLPG